MLIIRTTKEPIAGPTSIPIRGEIEVHSTEKRDAHLENRKCGGSTKRSEGYLPVVDLFYGPDPVKSN
jgi:hypothetical protein